MKKNSLSSKFPEIAKEWHPTKNGELLPTEVSFGSQKSVWWQCSKGHEWESRIANRTGNGRGCPYCAGRKVLAGYNDLATTHPDLSKEWHPTKNGELKPENVSSGIGKKVWWKCSNGHEWQAYVYNRVKGHACPYCSGRTVLEGFNDLATTHPGLAEEWHPIKNEKLLATQVMAGSHKKVWWRCSEGHEWIAEIKSRVQGHSCPICSNQYVLEGFNDLATTYPELVNEWHPTKNGNLTPRDVVYGSTQRVWWKCSKGHEWETKIVSRTHMKTGCPYCVSELHTSFPEQAIFYYIGKKTKAFNRYLIQGKEIDIYLPEYKIGIEYNGRYYHQDKQRDNEKVIFFKNLGIRIISVNEGDVNTIQEDAIEYTYSRLKKESLNWAIRSLMDNIGLGNIDINVEKDETEIYASYIRLEKENSLWAQNPELAKEWHPTKNNGLIPQKVTFGSGKKVWWLGECGHEWTATINSRIKGNGCPICNGNQVLEGFNDLATTHPELAQEWHPTKNKELLPQNVTFGSRKRIWWQCSKGHEWETKVNSRTSKKSGCPYCMGRKVWEGFNDLATTHPELAKEWHPTKNESLKPQHISQGSGKKVWWLGKCGHEWQAYVYSRSMGQGCPICNQMRE